MKTYQAKDLHSKAHVTTLIRGLFMLAIIGVAVIFIKLGKIDDLISKNGGIKLSENMTGVYIIAACLAGIFLLINFDNFFMSRKYEKLVRKYTDAELLEQVQNHLIYVHKKGKKPIFFTQKYLIAVNTNIIPMALIDWQYTVTNRNGPVFKLKTLEDKEVATGISGYDKHAKPCIEALVKANPNLIVGYSLENSKLHKKHVSAYKKQK